MTAFCHESSNGFERASERVARIVENATINSSYAYKNKIINYCDVNAVESMHHAIHIAMGGT